MKFFKQLKVHIKTLVVMAGLLLFATSAFSHTATFPDGNKRKAEEIRVMSYNIRIAHPPSKGWSEVDLPAIARVIKNANPDLVALQEVDAYTERSGKKIHQASELAKMTGMNFFFAKAIDRSGGDYGVAVLSRFPIIESKGFRLPVRDTIKSEIRALAVIKVQMPDGENIVFCSTHFDHLADEDRLMQARTMTDIIEKYSAYPVIMGADFNMQPDNPVMDSIRKVLTVDCETFPLTFPTVNPKRTIDYVLLNKAGIDKFNIVKYHTLKEEYASDHLPVEVVLDKKSQK